MMADLRELLDRVETATDFDRDLDRDIGLAIGGWKIVEYATPNPTKMLEIGGDIYPDHPGSMYPALTESVDDALALLLGLLPNARLQLTRDPDLDGWWSRSTDEPNSIHAATPALAILAALLRALLPPSEPAHD